MILLFLQKARQVAELLLSSEEKQNRTSPLLKKLLENTSDVEVLAKSDNTRKDEKQGRKKSGPKKRGKAVARSDEFTCKYCPARFSYKYRLRLHEKTHAAHKPYSCDICGRKFMKTRSLRKHMMSHTGEQPFSCDFCDKKFSMKTVLMLAEQMLDRIEYLQNHENEDIYRKAYEIIETYFRDDEADADN